jgi:threonine dehydrogenase-like Zn-dependent dehydrogenase
MQAYVFKAVGVLEPESVDIPDIGPGEALVEPVAVGICGSDIHGFAGESGRRSPGQVMGHEFSGRIVRVGSGEQDGDGAATAFRPGDHVVVNPLVGCGSCRHCSTGRPQRCRDRYVIGSDLGHHGGFADQVRVPLLNVHPLPRGLAPELGALAEPLAVAVHAVRRAGVTDGDAVGIVGAGPIGQCLVLACRQAGARSIHVAELDASRWEAAHSLGAEVGEIPDGSTEVAFDAVGNDATLEAAVRMTGPGATICLAGMSSGILALNAFAISAEERGVLGTFCYTPEDFARALELLSEIGEDARRLVACTIPRADLPAMMTRLGGGYLPVGKVLVLS